MSAINKLGKWGNDIGNYFSKIEKNAKDTFDIYGKAGKNILSSQEKTIKELFKKRGVIISDDQFKELMVLAKKEYPKQSINDLELGQWGTLINKYNSTATAPIQLVIITILLNLFMI